MLALGYDKTTCLNFKRNMLDLIFARSRGLRRLLGVVKIVVELLIMLLFSNGMLTCFNNLFIEMIFWEFCKLEGTVKFLI